MAGVCCGGVVSRVTHSGGSTYISTAAVGPCEPRETGGGCGGHGGSGPGGKERGLSPRANKHDFFLFLPEMHKTPTPAVPARCEGTAKRCRVFTVNPVHIQRGWGGSGALFCPCPGPQPNQLLPSLFCHRHSPTPALIPAAHALYRTQLHPTPPTPHTLHPPLPAPPPPRLFAALAPSLPARCGTRSPDVDLPAAASDLSDALAPSPRPAASAGVWWCDAPHR